MFPPSLTDALVSLQRQIDQINTARPGPMSWGPRDGHVRFYDAAGNTLFRVDSGGASVVSRGSLSGLTGLLDGIRDKNDNQDGVLSDHREWLIGQGERLDGHDADVKRIDGVNAAQNGRLNDHHEWIGSLGDRMGEAESVNAGQNGRLDDHSDWIVGARNAANAAQSSANAAQSRADSAYSRAGTAQSRADSAYSIGSSARSRADSAYSLAAGRATQAQIAKLEDEIAALEARIDNLGPR